MSEKLELVKKCTFAKMPELKQHDWDDMLESDGYLTFLKGVEDAMDKHLLKHYHKLSEFIDQNFQQKVNSFDDWIDLKRGVVVSSERVLIAYNEHIAPPVRQTRNFEDDGAYAD
jgi:hypothetical protein